MNLTRYASQVADMLRQGLYTEEITQRLPVDSCAVHRVARYYGLKARHAPRRPDFMRLQRIAALCQRHGIDKTAFDMKLSRTTILTHLHRYREMNRDRHATNPHRLGQPKKTDRQAQDLRSDRER